MTCSNQLEAILVAQSEAAPEDGDVHVWGLPEDMSLLRLGQARLCDARPLTKPEVIYHINAIEIAGECYCGACGESTFPEA